MLEDIINISKKTYKNSKLSTSIQQNKKNSYIKNFFDFDKDTEFLISQITPDSSFIIPKKTIKENAKNQKESIPKKNQSKHNHQHTKCSSCVHCHPYFKMLKKQRKRLVNFINNNEGRNIKLIGNIRYSRNSPLKFVHDTKKHLSGRKMGIIPIPLKKKKKNLSQLESVNYYDLQRAIVMMRRIQYDRKIRKEEYYNFLDDVILIQNWWKKLKNEKKIKKIQRAFRDLLRKRKLKLLKYLKNNFKNIQTKINKILLRKCFNKIKNYNHIKRPIINSDLSRNKDKKIKNNYYYMSKEINFVSVSFINKINDLQNNYRIHNAILKKNKLLKNNKFKPINKRQSLITKITVSENLLNNKINMLQRNIRYFILENKKKKIIKIKNKENFGLYINKINLNTNILKIIEFNKKLKHAMKLIVLRKKEKKTKYKNYKDYNINDIYEISKIQKQYKLHYNKYNINKNKLIKIYSNKSFINCYISKKRKVKNNKVLLLMQKALKSTLKRIRFEKNIIKNKPKSIDFNSMNFNKDNTSFPKNNEKYLGKSNINNFKYIQSNNDLKENNQNNFLKNNQNFSIDEVKEYDSLNNKYTISSAKNVNIFSSREFNKNNINYNLVSYISKKRIINVNQKLILLQRAIKPFLFIKNAKKDYYNNKNCLFINKTNIDKVFYISKNITNEEDCTAKIIKIQQYYKNRFNYFKNNIIKYTISTEREEELLKFPHKLINNFNLYGNYNSKYNSTYYYNNSLKEKLKDKNIIGKKNNLNINTIETDSFAIENKLSENKKIMQGFRRNSFQTQKNRFLLLSYLVDRNKKPIQQIIGNYYTKTRVNSKVYEQFVNKKNRYFINFNQTNRGLYITKNRYKNNISQIKLIQKYFLIRKNKKNIQKEKNIIFHKPLNHNYIIFADKKNEITKKKGEDKVKSYYSSKDSKNDLEEDSYFESIDKDFGDLIGEKVYTIYNKNNIIRKPHLYMNNYYYMSKEIRYKEKEEFSSLKEYESIKKDLKQRRLKNKKISPENSMYSSDKSQNSNRMKKKYENLKKKNKIDKNKKIASPIEIKNQKDKSYTNIKAYNKNKNPLNQDRNLENVQKLNKIKINICYIEKLRFKNNKIIKIIKKDIRNIKKEKEKEKNEKKEIDTNKIKNIKYIINVTYLKPLNDICFISKNIKYNGYGHRDLISSKIKDNKCNNFLMDDIKINNNLKKMQIIDKNNLINNNINTNNSINNSLNNINNSQINNINDKKCLNNNNNKKTIENDSNSYSSEKVSNGNNMISLDSRNNKNKNKNKIKKNFNSININNKISYFHNKINYINFIQMLNLFIVKNTQEYIFYKFLHYMQIHYNIMPKIIINFYNNSHFNFPFYIQSLKRIFKYIIKENKQNKRIRTFFNSIFPSINKNKSFFYLLICLTFENKKKLINTNLYNSNTEKNIMAQLLDDFSKSDKKISNKEFINDKINKTKFHNTNIFTLVKFIDIEYDKLNNSIYCQKCYQLQKTCFCTNKKSIINYYSNISGEDILERDLNEDIALKSGNIKINYFIDGDDEDKIKRSSIKENEIIYIKKKPKTNNKDNNSLLYIYNY